MGANRTSQLLPIWLLPQVCLVLQTSTACFLLSSTPVGVLIVLLKQCTRSQRSPVLSLVQSSLSGGDARSALQAWPELRTRALCYHLSIPRHHPPSHFPLRTTSRRWGFKVPSLERLRTNTNNPDPYGLRQAPPTLPVQPPHPCPRGYPSSRVPTMLKRETST
jgi:hypothetical protein